MNEELKEAEEIVSKQLKEFTNEGIEVPSIVQDLLVDFGTNCYLLGKSDGFDECKQIIKERYKNAN